MVITMARQSWNPDNATEEQLRLRQAAIDAFQQVDAVTADAWRAAHAAHQAGVPMEDLAEQTGRSRATLFRHTKALPADQSPT